MRRTTVCLLHCELAILLCAAALTRPAAALAAGSSSAASSKHLSQRWGRLPDELRTTSQNSPMRSEWPWGVMAGSRHTAKQPSFVESAKSTPTVGARLPGGAGLREGTAQKPPPASLTSQGLRKGHSLHSQPTLEPGGRRGRPTNQNRTKVEVGNDIKNMVDGKEPPDFLGVPKFWWAFIADIMALLLFVTCIPCVLTIAKQRRGPNTC
mmetsp:Transcript_98692/g.170908  ORF Transcript_98692/g.170908 Transcript_98692/m.170908 type:complete len:209 (+) Transcript_98692:189-815(+)